MAWRHREQLSRRQVFPKLMILSLMCLCIPRSLTDHVDRFLSLVLGPLSKTSRWVSLAVTDQIVPADSQPVSTEQYRHLQAEYRRGQNELINITQQLRRQRQLNAQLSGLRQQFGLAQVTLIEAHIVGDDSISWRQIRRLDKGSQCRIEPGQIVLSAVGPPVPCEPSEPADAYQMCVVGRIKDVGAKTCTVQLVNDPGFRMAVFIAPQSTRHECWRAKGLLQGKGMGQIIVKMVPTNYPVQPGDVVLSCLEPKYLPTPMVLGTVKSCKRDDDNPVMWHITMSSGADLNTLRRVIVVQAK